MYCKNCGNEVTGKPKFCPFCGAVIESTSQDGQPVQDFSSSTGDKELIKYIKDSLGKGLSRQEIEVSLKNVGWQQEKIDNAFLAVEAGGQQQSSWDTAQQNQQTQEVFQPQQTMGQSDFQNSSQPQGQILTQPEMQQPLNQFQQTKAQFIHAGFWMRFLANFIDGLFLGLIIWAVGFFIGIFLAPILSNPQYPTKSELAFLNFIGRIISIIVGWLYYSLLESSRKQGTIGKMILGLRVTDENYQKISFGKATGRYFSRILAAFIFGIGFLMIAWDEQKQGLHDKIVRTFVVKSPED